MRSKPVFLHLYRQGKREPENIPRSDFARVPLVGEFVADGDSLNLFQVRLVVHCPFDDAHYAAEVFAVEDRTSTELFNEVADRARGTALTRSHPAPSNQYPGS